MSEQLTRDYVERCHEDVRRAAARLHAPRFTQDLVAGLHRSLSGFLRHEIGRLRSRRSVGVLSDKLHTRSVHRQSEPDLADLERVVRLRATNWRAGVIELLQRLEGDWGQLVRQFELRHDAGLTDISEPLGDMHNSGRSVYGLRFEDESTLIYKPRSVETEHTFSKVVQWLGRQGWWPELKCCRVMSKAGYGWTNYVTPQHCQTSAEAEAYYERQGGFLTLFFCFVGGIASRAT